MSLPYVDDGTARESGCHAETSRKPAQHGELPHVSREIEWNPTFAEVCAGKSYDEALDTLLPVVNDRVSDDASLRDGIAKARAFLRAKFPEAVAVAKASMSTENSPTHGLVIVGADQFAAKEFEPREYLLVPWLQEKNVVMVYGPRGVGKTLVGIGIALAVSTGADFLRWHAPKARRVLYIDGELPQETLQKRLNDVAASIRTTPTSELRLLTPDQQIAARIPNLADPEGQRIIEDCIAHEQADLVVFDNLSTLCRSGEENAAESWQVIQDWLVHLRSTRRSVLLIHHAGKSGDQRGTSKREDVLDCSLKIARPTDYKPEQGARFEVHFEKARDPFGTAVAPFEAQLEASGWTVKALAGERDERIRRLSTEGQTQREIADEVGCSVGTVNKVLNSRQR